MTVFLQFTVIFFPLRVLIGKYDHQMVQRVTPVSCSSALLNIFAQNQATSGDAAVGLNLLHFFDVFWV